MVVDGEDPWEAKPYAAVRSSWPRGGANGKRGWPHGCRTRPWPPPPTTTFAAYGRQEGGGGVSPARRGFGVHGEKRDEAAAAAGGNAASDLVRDGAERFSGLVAGVAAREDRGSGGGDRGFGWRRGLAPAAPPPPHKRRAVSSARRFPAISGRDPADPVVRSGDEDGLRVGPSTSHGWFGSEEGVLLPAVLEKVVAAKGGASVADWYPHGPNAHASVGNAGFLEINDAGGFFGSVLERGRGARSDQLRKKHLETLPDVGGLDASGSLVAYQQSATVTVGAMMNGDGAEEGQELEEGEIADTMEITQGMIKNERKKHLETLPDVGGLDANGSLVAYQQSATVTVGAMMNVDGAEEGQELEEGEIADTVEITQGMIKNDALSRPIERKELGEGEIAATMDNAEDMNKNVSDGAVEGHKLEVGGTATTMDTVLAMNIDALYGSVEGQELEEGEIASPLDIVEAMKEDTLDGAVEVQEFEQGVIAVTMNTMESMNNQALQGVVVVVRELEESKIVAMDIAEGTSKDTFAGPVEGWELKNEIAAKEHRQEPKDGEIATKSGHTVQLSQFSIDVIPRDSTGGIMRRKIKFTVGKTVQPPVEANNMSQLVTLDRPFSSTSATTMKKLKAAQSKHVPIDIASTSALASKEKRKFEPVFVSKEELKGKRAIYLEDDDILKAVAVHGGKLELCLGSPSRIRSIWRHRSRGGEQNADHRSRVRMMCRRFQFLCRFLSQAVKQGSMELPRVDLAADHVIKKLPDYIKYGSSVGEVDGVEVGDEFLFRVELAIVGLHNPYRAGIDTTKDTDGELIAVSIVASGGYLDEYCSSGELIYIGSGGKAAGTNQDGDQILERGNLALKNCIERKIPVRVTHGFKTPNREEGSHSIGKEIPNFIYDGLYHVVGFRQQGIPGSMVFKYKLRRIPGQPELPLHVAKWLRKSVVRPR